MIAELRSGEPLRTRTGNRTIVGQCGAWPMEEGTGKWELEPDEDYLLQETVIKAEREKKYLGFFMFLPSNFYLCLILFSFK